MKQRWIIAGLALSFVTMSQAFEYAYVANSTWTSNSYESTDLTGFGGWMRYFDDGSAGTGGTPPGGFYDGCGQLFQVTNDFTVEEVRIWTSRYYTTNQMTFTLYKNVDSFGIPMDAMVESNIVAQFVMNPTNALQAGSGGPGDVLAITLEESEYFDMAPLAATNLYYYFHGQMTDTSPPPAETGTVFLWNYSNDYDTNGYYIAPDGTTGGDRDLGVAFLSTNPPVVIVEPIPTNWIIADNDALLKPLERPSGNYGAGDLGIRTHESGGLQIRDYFSYVRFDLTDYAGSTITNAAFEFTFSSYGAEVTNRTQVLGLNNVSGNTPQDWLEGSLTADSLGAEFIPDNIGPALLEFDKEGGLVADFDALVTNTVETINTTNGLFSVSGQPLVDFLNERLQDPGTNGNVYVTLIINSVVFGNNYSWGISSKEATDEWSKPHLILDRTGGGPVGPEFDPSINGIAISGGTVTISWDSDEKGTYKIESKAALTDSWSPVTGASNLPPAGASGTNTSFSASGGDTEFFRVYGE